MKVSLALSKWIFLGGSVFWKINVILQQHVLQSHMQLSPNKIGISFIYMINFTHELNLEHLSSWYNYITSLQGMWFTAKSYNNWKQLCVLLTYHNILVVMTNCYKLLQTKLPGKIFLKTWYFLISTKLWSFFFLFMVGPFFLSYRYLNLHAQYKLPYEKHCYIDQVPRPEWQPNCILCLCTGASSSAGIDWARGVLGVREHLLP